MALETLDNTVLHQGRFLKFLHRKVKDTAGGEYTWELVERTTQGPIVVIIPITASGEVLLAQIYRVPVEDKVVEFFAGLRGENEPIEETAKRELLEEAGWRVERVERLFGGPYDAGLIGEEIVYFVGFDAVEVQAPEREAVEDLEIFKMPLSKLGGWLGAQSARVDPKCWAALYFLEKHPELQRFFHG
jgi:ADP-ribose pyrophosphatase